MITIAGIQYWIVTVHCRLVDQQHLTYLHPCWYDYGFRLHPNQNGSIRALNVELIWMLCSLCQKINRFVRTTLFDLAVAQLLFHLQFTEIVAKHWHHCDMFDNRLRKANTMEPTFQKHVLLLIIWTHHLQDRCLIFSSNKCGYSSYFPCSCARLWGNARLNPELQIVLIQIQKYMY